jgi:hypothetical protein
MVKKALEWLELERTKRRIGVCRGWHGTWKRRREGGLVQHSAKAGERWGGGPAGGRTQARRRWVEQRGGRGAARAWRGPGMGRWTMGWPGE